MRRCTVLRVLFVSGAWTDAEIAATLNLYAYMLKHYQPGGEHLILNKAETIRQWRGEVEGIEGPLKARSKGSVEMKLMNVTAAVEACGRPDLSMAEHGYRPMTNMQAALKIAVTEWVKFSPKSKAAAA